jgi:hypothetical protein
MLPVSTTAPAPTTTTTGTLLDFTDVYCGEELCQPVVGGANIYRDQDHLTVTFTDTLKPWYQAAIQSALVPRGE